MLKFLKQSIKEFKNTGSIAPSSKFLAKKMLNSIDFSKDSIIVEYGPGTGPITKVIRSKMSKDSKLYVIENNLYFYEFLKKEYKSDKNIYIILDSVENISNIVEEEIDYIISAIPFLSLPKRVSINILRTTKKKMSEKTIFMSFQYSLLMKKRFLKYFNINDISYEFRNVPPAFIFEMSL